MANGDKLSFPKTNDFQVDGQMPEQRAERLDGSASRKSASREPRYKNIVHLWEFLLELLAYGHECRRIIAWIREEHGEFKLRNPQEVAKIWGAYKQRRGMNYEKLSRALRYYYQKGIIRKVVGQRLMYKFDKLPYKYVPSVTKSRCHGHRINACIQKQLREMEFVPSRVNNSYLSFSFSPVSTAVSKRCCCPIKPLLSRPIMWCPGPMPHAPPISYYKTRVMFPFTTADRMMPLPLLLGINPHTVNLSPETRVLQAPNPYFYNKF